MKSGSRLLALLFRSKFVRPLRLLSRLALIAISSLVFIASTASAARADDDGCQKGISATYQYAPSLLEHAAEKANGEIDNKVRPYLPSAAPIDLARPEHMLQLNYDWQLRNYVMLRFYGGFSVQPSAAVYTTSGDGQYQPKGFDHPIPIGQVDASITHSGYLVTTGADALFMTGRCRRTMLHLVGGFGLGATYFSGDLRADIDALITSQNPDVTLRGSYYGFAFHGQLVAGLRFDFSKYADVMVLGGYRAGLGYVNLHSDILNKDGMLPVYGPFFQVTAGWKF